MTSRNASLLPFTRAKSSNKAALTNEPFFLDLAALILFCTSMPRLCRGDKSPAGLDRIFFSGINVDRSER